MSDKSEAKKNQYLILYNNILLYRDRFGLKFNSGTIYIYIVLVCYI